MSKRQLHKPKRLNHNVADCGHKYQRCRHNHRIKIGVGDWGRARLATKNAGSRGKLRDNETLDILQILLFVILSSFHRRAQICLKN